MFPREPNTHKSLKMRKNNAQDLYLQCPNNYSQSSEAAQLMLRAYGHEDVEDTTDFKWSEIFPIVRRPSRSHLVSNNKKSVTFCLDPVNETHLLCEVLPGHGATKLRLPHIDAPRSRELAILTKPGYRSWSNGESDLDDMSLRNSQSHVTDSRKNMSMSRLSNNSLCDSRHGEEGTSTERVSRYHESGNTGLVIKLPQIANLRVAAQNS